ncbi:class F sortase [Kitasatospora kifunensis]|uniref:Sortase (Surface protein transpeptidase) n=1 Tax=Kitasatospora kifunensis TaxID=58351 RepID=A0A7W7R4W0_KITKI|nr:class F sortase [Kitasatospora kifunensis]MBB4925264.1 sortase (surface protein transpeptidase) [Kitasatospora kifunensis]
MRARRPERRRHGRRPRRWAPFAAGGTLALALGGFLLGHTTQQPPPVRINTVAAAPADSPATVPVAPPSGGPSAGAQPPAPPAQAAPPTRLVIPSIGVDAPVGPGGLNSDGTVEVPPLDQPSRVDWYDQGPAPGAVGPAVLLGHLDTKAGPAVFAKLPKLKPGDKIEIHRADGSTVTFQVRELHQYAKDAFPTDLVYGSTSTPQLRVITCGGSLQSNGHYSDNIIVFADLVSS